MGRRKLLDYGGSGQTVGGPRDPILDAILGAPGDQTPLVALRRFCWVLVPGVDKFVSNNLQICIKPFKVSCVRPLDS